MMKALMFCALGLIAFEGCKKRSLSNTKFDPTVADALRVDQALRQTEIEFICNKKPVFFFFGNAEPATFDVTSARPNIKSTQNLLSIVQEGAKEMKAGLSRMSSACSMAFSQDASPNYRALLVTVVDGPGQNDTQIESTWFYFEKEKSQGTAAASVDANGNSYTPGWKSESQSWTIDAASQLVKTDSGTSEIHLPTQIEPVVEYFLKMQPPSANKKLAAERSPSPNAALPLFFDQSFYFFKGHGGRYKLQSEPDLASTYAAANIQTSTPPAKVLPDTPIPKLVDDGYNHAFMFDPHGPMKDGAGGELQLAELYSVGYNIDHGCKLFAELAGAEPANPDLCSKCLPYLRANPAGAGPFAKCAGMPQRTEDGKTLDFGTNTTLDFGTNTTLDFGTNTTLDFGTNTTLSAGKSSFLTKLPVGGNWDKVQQVATGITYAGKDNVPGLSRMTIPMLGDTRSPPFISLDSCWGDNRIISNSFAQSTRNPRGTTVVMVNALPMGLNTIKYGTLGVFEYLALPYIENAYYDRRSAASDAVMRAKEKIDEHIAKNGLVNDPNATNQDKTQRQVRIYVIKDNEVVDGSFRKK